VVLDAALTGRMRHAGLARAAGFSWGEAARRTIETYRQLMGGSHSGAAAQAPGRGPTAKRG
jgi:hypothetical protein